MLAVAAALVAGQAGAQAVPSGCDGAPNTLGTYSGALQLQRPVPNGALYTYGPVRARVGGPGGRAGRRGREHAGCRGRGGLPCAQASLSPPLYVAHVTGNAYEMGQAYGALLRSQISQLVPETFLYLEQQINSSIGWLPAPIRDAIEVGGLELALNITIDTTAPYTPKHFFDTINGMANTTGVPAHTLLQVALIPELIKASCTVLSAWGPATASTAHPGALTQLRLLDWGTDGPFQQFPLVLCYHPTGTTDDDFENGAEGHDFCVLTWAGLVGAITGLSSSGIGVQEKVWLSYTGLERIDGYPFHFLMQDILQYDECVDDALSRVATANRTCSIWLGIGSSNEGYAKVLQYSAEEVNIYNPLNYPTAPDGAHTRYNGVVYVDKHVQPSGNPCLPSLVGEFYGNINAANGIQIAAIEASGNMHAAIYDWGAGMFYVANASPNTPNGTVIPAYSRQFLALNMSSQLFDASLAAGHL